MSVSLALIDPDDVVSLTIGNWADVLPATVTLGTVTHTVPAPLTKVSESTDTGAATSTVRVSGALHGGLYLIEAQSTLSNGEVVNRQFPVRCFNG